MEGKQLSTFVIALVSLLVTTVVVAVRCVVRINIKGFGLDDWRYGRLPLRCGTHADLYTEVWQLARSFLLAHVSLSCGDVSRVLVSETFTSQLSEQ